MSLRRANRQIEVFDISLMAVVTKAMGAFLVMMLLLLPYYTGAPPNITSPETARKAVADARQQVAEVTRNAGRFAQDPAELLRRLQAAQEALQKADAAIREMKMQLDQVWSQLTRSQHELAEARQEIARDQQQLARDRQVIADLEAQLRKQQPSRPPQLMATLDLIAGPTCHGGLHDPRLELTPETVFVASGASQASEQKAIGNVDMPWVVQRVLTSSDWATDIQQRLLYLSASPGTSYVAVTGDREPSPACQIVGQISVVALGSPDANGAIHIGTLAIALGQNLPHKGPVLIAVVGFDGKDPVVRPPSKADISAWSTAMGGHVPTQPEPVGATTTNGPVGPGMPVSKPSTPGPSNTGPLQSPRKSFGPAVPASPHDNVPSSPK